MQRSAKDHQRLSALGKTLAVLEAVTDHPHGIGLPDLAASLGLPRQTVHRLLGQLQSKRPAACAILRVNASWSALA